MFNQGLPPLQRRPRYFNQSEGKVKYTMTMILVSLAILICSVVIYLMREQGAFNDLLDKYKSITHQNMDLANRLRRTEELLESTRETQNNHMEKFNQTNETLKLHQEKIEILSKKYFLLREKIKPMQVELKSSGSIILDRPKKKKEVTQ